MKIVVCCVPYDGGKSGISVYMRSLLAALRQLGHEVLVLAEPGDTKYFPGMTVQELPKWTKRALLSTFYCLLILPFRLRRLNCDCCIIAAGNRRMLLFYPLFTFQVIHDLANFHVPGKYDSWRMLYLRRVLPFFARRAQVLVAVSRSTASDMRRFWSLPPSRKVAVIYNGLTLPSRSRSGFCARHDLEPGKYILYISRLEHPGKNHCHLIRAFELLPPSLSEYKLVLAGADWSKAEVVRKRARQSPRADAIVFPGFVESLDLAEAYSGAAVYVFPSFFEGFGLSLIEAMHYGVPCCCSRTSSLGEIGQGAALLFDPYDPAAMTTAIKRILTEPELRRQLTEAGKLRAADFNWQKHAREMTKLYEEQIRQKKRRRSALLGIAVNRLNTQEALARIMQLASTPRDARCRMVVTLNVDFLVNALPFAGNRPVPGLLEVLRQADLVTPDGMPLVLLSKILGCPLPERVTGADLVPMIAEQAAKTGVKLYFLGGEKTATEQAADILRERFPGLNIVGIDTPVVALDDSEATRANDAAIRARIQAAAPDLLLVAFGNPKQELWLARQAEALPVPVAMGVGGSFNFISGKVRRAPRWMQKSGLEWIYRIVQEPRRLWKRYLRGIFVFGGMATMAIAAQAAGAIMQLIYCGKKADIYQKNGALNVDCQKVVFCDNDFRVRLLQARQMSQEKNLALKIANVNWCLKMQMRAHKIDC